MGFAGLERDTITGLNLAVFRQENPSTGRWTSQDPLGFAAGDANLYRYVGNDSTGMVDPSGLEQESLPTKSTVEGISTGVINQLKKKKGSYGSEVNGTRIT